MTCDCCLQTVWMLLLLSFIRYGVLCLVGSVESSTWKWQWNVKSINKYPAGKTLRLEYTFIVSKAVRLLLDCIYVALQFRSSPIHNTMWAVRKCLAFIRRSASYHRTAEGRCWSADIKWLHKHSGCANGKNVVPLKCWSVSTTLLHIYVLIARIIISSLRYPCSLSVCILWGSDELAWHEISKLYSSIVQQTDVTVLWIACWINNLAFQQACSQCLMERHIVVVVMTVLVDGPSGALIPAYAHILSFLKMSRAVPEPHGVLFFFFRIYRLI